MVTCMHMHVYAAVSVYVRVRVCVYNSALYVRVYVMYTDMLYYNDIIYYNMYNTSYHTI